MMNKLVPKSKSFARQRSIKLNFSSKIANNSSINIYKNIKRFNSLHYNYNDVLRIEGQKREKVIIRYRICHRRKTQFLELGNYFPEIIEELMDKLRDVLNIMLENENGMYNKNEILKVSKELDTIIYLYYNTLKMGIKSSKCKFNMLKAFHSKNY